VQKHHIVKAYKAYTVDPIPVVTRSKAWACSRLLAGIVGATAAWGKECLSLVYVGCCSGVGRCRGLITRAEESYQVWCF